MTRRGSRLQSLDLSAKLKELCKYCAEPVPKFDGHASRVGLGCVYRDKLAIIKLLDEGADINGLVGGGKKTLPMTPLSLVCTAWSEDLVECVQLLLDRGADVNGGHTEFSVPLAIAVSNGAFYVVRELLRWGPRVGRVADEAIDRIRTIRKHPAAERERSERTRIKEMVGVLRHTQLMQRWRRGASQVGRLSLFFKVVFEEVHYRPQHVEGRRAKRTGMAQQALLCVNCGDAPPPHRRTWGRCQICVARDLPSTYYCSEDCMNAHWPQHKVYHMEARKLAIEIRDGPLLERDPTTELSRVSSLHQGHLKFGGNHAAASRQPQFDGPPTAPEHRLHRPMSEEEWHARRKHEDDCQKLEKDESPMTPPKEGYPPLSPQFLAHGPMHAVLTSELVDQREHKLHHARMAEQCDKEAARLLSMEEAARLLSMDRKAKAKAMAEKESEVKAAAAAQDDEAAPKKPTTAYWAYCAYVLRELLPGEQEADVTELARVMEPSSRLGTLLLNAWKELGAEEKGRYAKECEEARKAAEAAANKAAEELLLEEAGEQQAAATKAAKRKGKKARQQAAAAERAQAEAAVEAARIAAEETARQQAKETQQRVAAEKARAKAAAEAARAAAKEEAARREAEEKRNRVEAERARAKAAAEAARAVAKRVEARVAAEEAAQAAATAAEAAAAAAAAAAADDDVPDEYICPITAEIMSDPVCLSDGFTYERAAIAQWLEGHDTSPKTGATLEHKHFFPNTSLRIMINNYRAERQA